MGCCGKGRVTMKRQSKGGFLMPQIEAEPESLILVKVFPGFDDLRVGGGVTKLVYDLSRKTLFIDPRDLENMKDMVAVEDASI